MPRLGEYGRVEGVSGVYLLVSTPFDAGGCVGRAALARRVRPTAKVGEFVFVTDRDPVRLADWTPLRKREAWNEAVALEQARIGKAGQA